jgi:hypothetical protein
MALRWWTAPASLEYRQNDWRAAMRPMTMMTLAGMTLAGGLAFASPGALAQSSATLLPATLLPVDRSALPQPPIYVAPAERNKAKLFATGAGAAVGIVVVDVLSGGLLLAPLGLPAFGELFGAGARAPAPVGAVVAAVPEVTYSISQRVLAAVGTMAAALGGGYLGPRLIGVDQLAQP